jgi:hypothetical protein
LVGSLDLIHWLFNCLDFGPVPPSVLKFGLFLGKDARQTPIRTCRLLRQCTVSDATRIKREGSVTTILTGQPGHCGRPASLLRSVTRLPKVFIGGLEVDLCLLRLCWFEPEIFEGDPSGLQSPQINGEQASTGHDRSFSSSSTSHSVSTKDVRKLLKAPPGGVPFL